MLICWGLTFEPIKHLLLVHGHPVLVGLGSLQRLLERRGGRAKLPGVVFFELQQLGRDRRGYWDSNLNVGINRNEL